MLRPHTADPAAYAPPTPRRVMILRRAELQCFCGEPFTRRHLLRRESLVECGARKDGKRCGITSLVLGGFKTPAFLEPEDDGNPCQQFLVAEVHGSEIPAMEHLRLADINEILRYLGFKGRPRLHGN